MTTQQSNDGVRITGSVSHDALVSYTPDAEPTAVLTLQLETSTGLPYTVRQVIGKDVNQQLAAVSKARLLRRGCEIAVYGKGLRVKSDHDIACLTVMDVSDILPLSVPSPTSTKQDA